MKNEPILTQLASQLTQKQIRVVDLTAPLSADTPVIRLPAERGQPWAFRLDVISRYDEKGQEVYWNNISMSEHTGTHFDAPVHWITGREYADVSQVPVQDLVAPAIVIDMSGQIDTPDFLLERHHVEAWCDRHGPLPEGGWLLYRTGWDARDHDVEAFLNAGHTPGISVECARWLAQDTPIMGIGVETVGTDAGQAKHMNPAYPVHWFMHGARKYGLTQLKNLKHLPPTGAVVVVSPLPIVGGSGSPCRAYALVSA
ncbi:cyclase family protein [Chitinimonas viridis]|uniref:Cyclase family protein n=1 Tax=Chitinimonas viridis TaxID=664880 RepID=A0ABT8B328_9NEIS|nr:cyclase family protein [Chitinimonas viridis]MDN3576662.1 cyclase family protein [Chitinimonas viridis]